MQRREMPCEGSLRLREGADGEESRTIEGLAIVFNRTSVPLYEDADVTIREVIAPEAVSRELLDNSDILCTLYHDNGRILARSNKGKGTLTYDVTEEGVRFSFDAPDTEDGRTALELVRRGEVSGCSFAFLVDTTDPEAQTREVTKKDGRREVVYTVRKIADIRDFTLTPRPAYSDTAVAARKRDAESEAVEEPEKAEDLRRLREISDRIN